MLKILDNHLPTILYIGLAAMFMYGIGYLIKTDSNHYAQRAIACIEAGHQVINGDCVK